MKPRFDDKIVEQMKNYQEITVDYAACKIHRRAFPYIDFLTWHYIEIYYKEGSPVVREEDRPRTKCVCCKHRQMNCECSFVGITETDKLLMMLEGYDFV